MLLVGGGSFPDSPGTITSHMSDISPNVAV
jgi:hypothetical protein